MGDCAQEQDEEGGEYCCECCCESYTSSHTSAQYCCESYTFSRTSAHAAAAYTVEQEPTPMNTRVELSYGLFLRCSSKGLSTHGSCPLNLENFIANNSVCELISHAGSQWETDLINLTPVLE